MKKERRYWDTDCFVAWLNKEYGKADKCKGVIQEAERGTIEIITSTLTIAEVLYLKEHKKIVPEKAEQIARFFENKYILPIVLDRYIAEMARTIYWGSNIKPKDAVHVASAMKAKIIRFDTFDKDLITFSGKIGNPALIIGEPNILSQENFQYEKRQNPKK